MDLDSLDQYTETIVTQEMPDGRVLEWQVVPISPADGARAGVGLAAVQAAVLKAGKGQATLGDDEEPAPVKEISLQQLADMGEYADRLCICGVRGLREQGEAAWSAVRLALETNKRANPPRLAVTMLHQGRTPEGGGVADAVAAAAASSMKDAAARAAQFRGRE